MGRVLSRVPVALAADASGVVVTVNQLGIVVGIAAFGALYLNLAGPLPARPGARAAQRVRALVGARLPGGDGRAGRAGAGRRAALALAHGRAAAPPAAAQG